MKHKFIYLSKALRKISCSEYHRIMTCNILYEFFNATAIRYTQIFIHCSVNGYCYHTYCNIHESQLCRFLLQTLNIKHKKKKKMKSEAVMKMEEKIMYKQTHTQIYTSTHTRSLSTSLIEI